MKNDWLVYLRRERTNSFNNFEHISYSWFIPSQNRLFVINKFEMVTLFLIFSSFALINNICKWRITSNICLPFTKADRRLVLIFTKTNFILKAKTQFWLSTLVVRLIFHTFLEVEVHLKLMVWMYGLDSWLEFVVNWQNNVILPK